MCPLSCGLSLVTQCMCMLIEYGISVVAISTKGLAFEYIKTRFRMCNKTRFCDKISSTRVLTFAANLCACTHFCTFFAKFSKFDHCTCICKETNKYMKTQFPVICGLLIFPIKITCVEILVRPICKITPAKTKDKSLSIYHFG